MKIIITLIVVCVLILSCQMLVFAGNDINVTVNGSKIIIDVKPFVDSSNRTLIPVRFVSEKLGANVGWDGEAREVTVDLDDKHITLKIDNKEITVNGKKQTMDTQAIIKESRTFVPVRFVAEALGGKVDWISSSRTVVITTSNAVTTTDKDSKMMVLIDCKDEAVRLKNISVELNYKVSRYARMFKLSDYEDAYNNAKDANLIAKDFFEKEEYKSALINFEIAIENFTHLSELIDEIINNLESDYDNDGLSNECELKHISIGINPIIIDTDRDGIDDPDEDIDEDGLTNLEEQNYGTTLYYDDTDIDGLTDYEEIRETKTDPLLEDPDEDELSDINEIKYGMDPFVYDTDGDGIKDGDEVFSVYIEPSQIESDPNVKPSIKMELEGKNISNVYISNCGEGIPYLTKNIPGYIGAAFDFHAPMTFDKAELKFEFNKELLNDDFYPAIYNFNSDTNLLELMPNQIVDLEEGSVTIEVSRFSIYIVLNKITVDEYWAEEMPAPRLGVNYAENITTIR